MRIEALLRTTPNLLAETKATSILKFSEYAISQRPWDVSPVLRSKLEMSKFPARIDALPPEVELGTNGFKGNLYELLKRNLPKLVSQPLVPPPDKRLPRFDLSRIPKVTVEDEVGEERILTPMIVESFAIDGRIAVFKTTDEHLYYVVPNRWLVSYNGLTVDRPKNAGNSIRLRFLLGPTYAWADALIEKIRVEDPLAFFVPIPKKFLEFRLDVPGVIGELRNQILPTDSMAIGDQIYMNVELNEEQLEIFQILNESKTYLTGSVVFTYPYSRNVEFKMVSEIWLNFQGF